MNSKILSKIKKCLQLAKSDNPNEAAAAMRQAQKLMELHGITQDDVAIGDIGSTKGKSDSGRKPPTHIAMLANMVSKAFGSRLIYAPEYDGQSWKGFVEFYGANGADEVSAYAFEVLGRQLKKDRTAYSRSLNKRLKRETKVRRADLYSQGWVESVREKITTQSVSSSTSYVLDLYAAKRWPDIENIEAKDRSHKARQHDHNSYGQGRSDGDKVDFHQGVKGSQRVGIEQGV